MKTWPSPLGNIYLGPVRDGLQEVISGLRPSMIAILADANTAEHCLPNLHHLVDTYHLVTINPGDTNKTLESCVRIWTSWTIAGLDRSALVLNLGGGMICDLGGFAAGCYQRGIRFGHIPTSLLGMADAALGGKTGVNFHGFKNYLGHFEYPAFTWVDPAFLSTLPEQEVRDGMTEIVKHAIIASPSLWNQISRLEHPNQASWMELLALNIPVKLQIAEQDPKEEGIRKTLNFGHTIGHALESYFMERPAPLTHGEAVTLGMLAESRLAFQTGLLPKEDFQAIIGVVMRLLRPREVTLPPVQDLRQWLDGDKKKKAGQVGFSLPDQIGSCRWDIPVSDDDLHESLDWLQIQVNSAR